MANEKQLTASQRIENLERGLSSMYNTLSNVARELTIAKEAIKLLGNKVDAMAQANAAGRLMTEDVISELMLANNVKELTEKVTNLVTQGFLEKAEEIKEGTFVVGNESDADGKVVNPRLQFTLSSLAEELQKQLIGKKVGETVTFQEDKLKFNVLEVYNIVTPKAPEETATEAAAPEAAPAEQSSSNAEVSQETAPAPQASSDSGN